MKKLNDRIESILKKIPHEHVTSKIRGTWGSSECDTYINGLLLADRKRNGFGPSVYSALFDLLTENELDIRSKLNVKNIDQISGNDWATKTSGWVIKKSPEKKI